jgi:hypothetical protein
VLPQEPPKTEDELMDWHTLNTKISNVIYPEQEHAQEENETAIIIQNSVLKFGG